MKRILIRAAALALLSALLLALSACGGKRGNGPADGPAATTDESTTGQDLPWDEF